MLFQQETQDILAPLTSSAIFLTVSVKEGTDPAQIRSFLGNFPSLVKDVAFRDPTNTTSCVVAIGHRIWDDVVGLPKPNQLRPFKEIKGDVHTAVSTPGDLLFHIRADRPDLCFALESLILSQLGDSVKVEDEVMGFRYFDARDLLGFVDGTANPVGEAKEVAALVGQEDAQYRGGSYVVVQKYMHQLPQWDKFSVEEQEAIIGRTKVNNFELPDAVGNAQKSHKTLNTIIDENGVEHDILRDNMPFGRPGEEEFGTYYIGYAGNLDITEEMLRRMFIGDPPGKYDRILDVSTPVTGTTFFAPTTDMLLTLARPLPTRTSVGEQPAVAQKSSTDQARHAEAPAQADHA